MGFSFEVPYCLTGSLFVTPDASLKMQGTFHTPFEGFARRWPRDALIWRYDLRPRPAAWRVEGDVLQLRVLAHGPQQHAAALHVAGARELAREEQPVAEDGEEQVDVLAGGDAPQEHDLGLGSELAELLGVGPHRLAVGRV